MIKFIKDNLDNDFERKLFEAAIYNLKNDDNPLRLNNFSYSIRELSSNLLHRLAPDSEVKKCKWYETLTDNNKPTRVQRMQFAVYGGMSDELLDQIELYPKEIKSEIKKLKKIIGSSSKYHTT